MPNALVRLLAWLRGKVVALDLRERDRDPMKVKVNIGIDMLAQFGLKTAIDQDARWVVVADVNDLGGQDPPSVAALMYSAAW